MDDIFLRTFKLEGELSQNIKNNGIKIAIATESSVHINYKGTTLATVNVQLEAYELSTILLDWETVTTYSAEIQGNYCKYYVDSMDECIWETVRLVDWYEKKETDSAALRPLDDKLDLYNAIKEWAKQQPEIIPHFGSCTDLKHGEDPKNTYFRYTTKATSEVFPDGKTANSGWKTKNRYFYEIRTDRGSMSPCFQFALSGINMPADLNIIAERINKYSPARKARSTDWEWRLHKKTERPELGTHPSVAELFKSLDKQYKEMKKYEEGLIQYLNKQI